MKNSKESQYFFVAMYLRLSRDDESKDGRPKVESNSIGSQRELIRAFLREQTDMELYDVYVDDGYSGSNFDRPELKRMMGDIEAGRVNCVVVKDLSRFGRDYIETGRYLEKIFPTRGVRFIAITDHYDSLLADVGERTIVLPVKNFINDSYCRDISMKVKSQLAVKRKAGEYLAPFALYGYRKNPSNKNQLIVDEYAAGIVRHIYKWKIEGMAVCAIADRLNELGVLSPKEYKRSVGENYRGGFIGSDRASWSSAAVKRILTEETYLGHLLQGRTERINYKIKKSIEKARDEWIRVENVHEPIISRDVFEMVQNLMRADGRASPGEKKISPFVGLLFCGDCKEQMIRRVNRYKDTCKVYYICSTKNRGSGCSRHSIEEDALKEMIREVLCTYVNGFVEQAQLLAGVKKPETSTSAITGYTKEVERLGEERDQYYRLCAGLHEDLQQGIVTKTEFERLYREFKRKAEALSKALAKQEELIKEVLKDGIVSAGRLRMFCEAMELKEIDRYLLVSLVKRIYVYENKKLEVEFYFQDQYRIMLELNRNMQAAKKERSA